MNGQAHTNGIEFIWALLKRGYHGSYHKMSVKHLSRYVDEFQHRWNHRDMHAVDFLKRTIEGTIGRRLTHRQLVDGDST